MATTLATIETIVRRHLAESSASFWSSAELIDLEIAGVKDLWRSVVDLKSEHFFTRDNTNVSLAADTATITGLPSDIHKVILIEPRDTSDTSSFRNLVFRPLNYQDPLFQTARSESAIDPSNNTIYYAITQAGGPVGALTVYVAPQVNSAVTLSFVYVPTLASMTSASNNPIPGEADNAVVAWTVAYARAKERDDRSPDPSWLTTYSTEKTNLLQSLGLRQLQEPEFSDAVFATYW